MTRVRRLEPEDASELTDLYGDYEWWADRNVDDVRVALAETDVAFGLDRNGELIAAARVLTDRIYYAMVYDVIVAAEYRSEGYGRRLMEAVVEAPELNDLGELALFCRRGLVRFYESIGFEPFDTDAPLPSGEREDFVLMTYCSET